MTTEDILEEIVGEIRDEFDTEEVLEIQKINKNHYILQSRVLIEEVNDLLGLDIAFFIKLLYDHSDFFIN